MQTYTILITGGSGFIGTNLIEHFKKLGHSVHNFDIKAPRNKQHYNYWTEIDIRNPSDLYHKTSELNPDYIVHLAARTDLDGKNPDDYSSNTIGVENILKASTNISCLKKVIITSSMLVCNLGYAPKNQFDYHPTTLYGYSKVITEKLTWANAPQCDWLIVRPTSIWGEWFDIPYRKFFDMIIKNQYFHIGKKSCTKTYGYVGNTVFQIEQLLFSNTLNDKNKIFYLGDTPPNNIEEWANEIAAVQNKKILRVPYSLIYIIAKFGDILKKFDRNFPMTSFRMKNMTTDNIINLTNTAMLVPNLPYTRVQGVKKTLAWIKSTT